MCFKREIQTPLRRSKKSLPMLLGYHQELLVEIMRRRRPDQPDPFGYEAELKMADDLIDNLRLLDEGNNTNLATTGRTKKRIHLAGL
jgi:hypothetical protein